MSVASELMGVVQDLCLTASAFLLGGQVSRSQSLVEQSTELLAHRARIVALELAKARSETLPSGDRCAN